MSDAKHAIVNFDTIDSPRSKLILLYLSTRSPATPRAISSDLDMPLITVFPIISMLRRQDLIQMRDGVCVLV